MNLILFILICYGMTMIAVYGRIFEKIRPRYHMFHCTMCMGFWVGAFVNFLMWILNKNIFDGIIIGTFLSACISSGTTYFLSKIVLDDGIRIVRKKNNEH